MRLKYLDVLKAFAIIAVLLYHSGFMTFGYLGVDIFLVINGYFITKSLYKNVIVERNQFGSGYLKFEISRLARLLPVLLLAGVVCMVVGYFTMLPDSYENLSASVIATNLFGNNILAAITTKNYWDVVNEYKPLMHTWYVGVVMQFYIVYPFLFFIARLDRKTPNRTLILMVSSLAVLSLLAYFGTTNAAHRFYYLPTRFFEFAVGGIVALTWSPSHGGRCHKWFVYFCYIVLIVLIVFNQEIMAANIRLVLVVALSVVLVMSSSVLENKVTANVFLAKIGAASYSIFVWHQVLLAFYRYIYSSHFTLVSYTLFMVVVAILSWMTFKLVEQKTNVWLKDKKNKTIFYIITTVVYLVCTGFAVYIYKLGGVVRDVPELYISRNEKIDHAQYNDEINKLNKPFETNKRHWLVVGNSFGRDFCNVILESRIADSVEVSYVDNYLESKYGERFASADRVFYSSLGANEKKVNELKAVCLTNRFDIKNLIVVGTKNFGESNGQIYQKRNRYDYFDSRIHMEDGYLEINEKMKHLLGEQYLDLIGMVIDEEKTMPVFTPDHHFISQDCRHFSKGGAIYFGQLIDWNKYLE